MWALHNEFFDHGTGMHVMHLKNAATGDTHILQIDLGADECAHCGHKVAKSNVGEIDARAEMQHHLDVLNDVYQSHVAYIKKYGIGDERKKP
jgi:uncharacterized protein (UPF0212 family)